MAEWLEHAPCSVAFVSSIRDKTHAKDQIETVFSAVNLRVQHTYKSEKKGGKTKGGGGRKFCFEEIGSCQACTPCNVIPTDGRKRSACCKHGARQRSKADQSG